MHGTILFRRIFPRKAEWVQADSAFCHTLHEVLKEDTLIQRFEWTGKNSGKDREDAAKDLRLILASSLGMYTSAQHVVIAHSHGGNVGIKALDDPSMVRVRLICLSTPLLTAVRRELFGQSAKFFLANHVRPFAGAVPFYLAR